MEITKTIKLKDRSAWREWLDKHHKNLTEIWLLSDDRPEESTVTYLDAVEEAICFGWIDDLNEKFIIAEDIIAVLKAEPNAWSNFLEFPDLYRRVRIGYIEEMRKNPNEFERRLQNFVNKTTENKMFGNWNDGGRLNQVYAQLLQL
jgi:uncharacterized protein YdeI (YjbR/CyaY-like superfamily)